MVSNKDQIFCQNPESRRLKTQNLTDDGDECKGKTEYSAPAPPVHPTDTILTPQKWSIHVLSTRKDGNPPHPRTMDDQIDELGGRASQAKSGRFL